MPKDLRNTVAVFWRKSTSDTQVERTGRYHQIPQPLFAAHGLEVRLIHPFTSKQHRTTTDPGNKTIDLPFDRGAESGKRPKIVGPAGPVGTIYGREA
jgi:hypothetical protein